MQVIRQALLPLVVMLGSCAPAPAGEVLLYVDTDALVPTLVGHFRLDVFTADGARWIESREITRRDERDWPVSFGVFETDVAARRVLVRLRASPEGKARDYRGERYLPKPSDAPPDMEWPDPPPRAEEGPRLYDRQGRDVTPATEPLPRLAIDRLLWLDIVPNQIRRVSVVLRGACFGAMADMGALRTCVDTEDTLSPVSVAPSSDDLAPSPPTPKTFGARTPCKGAPQGAVCIDGGGFVFGNTDQAGDTRGAFQPGFPERVAVISPFAMQRFETTVGEWRAAVAAGFVSPDGPPVVNDGDLIPGNNHVCTYTTIVGTRERFPVNCITWASARAYCRFLGGDLPTEAEWEYVAQAYDRPSKTRYPWGDDDPTCDRAVFGRYWNALPQGADNCVVYQSAPIGPASEDELTRDRSIGADLVGLGGNVGEPVRDAFVSLGAACWASASVRDPRCDAAIPQRSTRGGAWQDVSLNLQSGTRLVSYDRDPFAGVRCVWEGR